MTTERIIQDIQSHYHRIKQAEAEARYYYDHYLDHSKAEYQRQFNEHLDNMQDAYAWAVSPWDHSSWQAYQPLAKANIPSAVRIGRLMLAGGMNLGDLPALVPFITQGHLFLMGDNRGDNQAAVQQLLQTLVLRLVVSIPPSSLRLLLADPIGAGGNLATFLPLPESLRGAEIYVKPEEIRLQLERVGKHVKDVIQTRLLNLYPTIEEYNAKAGAVAVPYHFLVVTDFPAGFDDRMADELLHIARNGPRTGVYLLASLNSNYEPPRDFKLEELTALGTTLSLRGTNKVTWNDPQLSRYTVQPDRLPSNVQTTYLLEQVGKAAKEQEALYLTFSQVAIPASERWTYSTADGLSIPIALNSMGNIHHFTLGQGLVYHGLIGGIVRSGKTNLLHVIITQLVLKYSPLELELYLVDFKEGVEFAHYLTYQLPHARVVAIESEREFGLSILRYLQKQMEERGRAFKQAGVGNLPDFRRRSRQPMSRLLLILDEYQVMFSEDDELAREAGRLLEDIVRRAPAFGIHLLLASQSPSGGSYSGSRAIYGQMALRIALQCRSQDAQAILGEGNDAANQLEKAGEAIYNDDRGLKERNVFTRIAYLPLDERQQVLSEIRALAKAKQYQPPQPTVTFQGGAPARLVGNADFRKLHRQGSWPQSQPMAHAWLGEPIEIKGPTAASLERYPGSNLMILGSKETESYGLLLSALLSLAVQRSPSAARFIVADFARPASPVGGLFKSLSLPHQVEIAGTRQAETSLTELITLLDERLAGDDGPEVYLFIAGLHRWRALRPPDPYGQSPVSKKLSRLADEGPEVGIHLIAWSDSIANLDRGMGRGAIKYFDLRVALRLPETDSNSLFSSRVASKLKDNRALFRREDWEAGKVEKFKPYPVPDKAILNQIMQRLTSRATRQFHSDSVSSLAFSPDGLSLAWASWQQTAVKLWDIQTGQVRQTFAGHSKYVWSVAFSPDGLLLASASHDGTVKLWEVATSATSMHTLAGHSNSVTCVVFSPDGLLLASGSADNTLIVWDVQSGQPRHTLKGHTGNVLSVAFSPDGKTLASASWDNSLKTWDVQTGKLLHTFWGHNAGVRSVAFSPDGLMLASGSWDKRVKLWDVQTGKFLRTLKGHDAPVTTVAFRCRANGLLLASGSHDQSVKLWSVKDKQLRQTFNGHKSPVSSVVFSPDGKQLASGDQDGNVMLWGV